MGFKSRLAPGRGVALASLALLVACGADEDILPGDRIDVRPSTIVPLGTETALPVSVPSAVANAEWPQLNGASSHFAGNVAISFPLTRAWTASIGEGNRRGGRITGGPVVYQGRIFTIDSAGQVSAFAQDGTVLWRTSLVPDGETTRGVFGGGIAVEDGVVIAGSGFSQVVALEAETGAIRWRQDTDAPVRAAPVIEDGHAYVVARDDTAYGIDLENGRLRWQVSSVEPEAGIAGGASPAARDGVVIIPFGSGEVTGVLARNGRRTWTTFVSGGRRGTVLGRINDITGDPVIAGNTVFVANQSGQFAALDQATGTRLWSAPDGALGPALAVDNSVFSITDQGILKRYRASDGAEVWAAPLPRFSNAAKRRGAYIHSGPLLVSDRILVASSDGVIRTFDPVTGEPLGETSIGNGVAAQPAIAGGRMYLVTDDGALLALE